MSLTNSVTESLTDFYFCHTKSNPRDLRPLRHLIRVIFERFLEDFQIFGGFTVFWKIFRFLKGFQIFRRFSDFWKIFRFLEDFQIFRRFLDFWNVFRILKDFQIFGRFSEFWKIFRFLEDLLTIENLNS